MPTVINQLENPQGKQKSNSYFSPCPLFTGKHKWSLLAFRLPQGLVSYCQFCYKEKLVPYALNEYTQYYPAGTYYSR